MYMAQVPTRLRARRTPTPRYTNSLYYVMLCYVILQYGIYKAAAGPEVDEVDEDGADAYEGEGEDDAPRLQFIIILYHIILYYILRRAGLRLMR